MRGAGRCSVWAMSVTRGRLPRATAAARRVSRHSAGLTGHRSSASGGRQSLLARMCRTAVMIVAFATPSPQGRRGSWPSVLTPGYRSVPAQRHDAGRIDAPVALVIVMLDMEEVDRLGDARQVVKLAQIAAQRRVVPDLPKIALEVPEINRVEADQGGEQAPVGFRQPLADEEALASRAAPRASRASRTAPGTPLRRPPARWRNRRDRRHC